MLPVLGREGGKSILPDLSPIPEAAAQPTGDENKLGQSGPWPAGFAGSPQREQDRKECPVLSEVSQLSCPRQNFVYFAFVRHSSAFRPNGRST